MLRLEITGRWGFVLAALFLCATVDPPQLLADERREVFIYYANENAPDEREAANYQTITGWLRSEGVAELDELADSLERDTSGFPAAVDEDIRVLQRRVSQSAQAPAAVVFTNRGVRAGKYWIVFPGKADIEEAPIEPPQYEHLVLASNPLTTAESLARCLREVGRRFPAKQHQFVLFTKSHGTEELAMTPRLVVRADDVDRDELIRFALAAEGQQPTPAWAKRLGITREEYFAVLDDAGREMGMQFPLVSVVSCKGVLDQDLKIRLPANVHRFYATGNEQTKYRNLDFEAIFDRCQQGVSLADAMEEQLAKKFPGIKHSSFWHRWRFVLYTAPFLAWVIWMIVRRRHVRRRR